MEKHRNIKSIFTKKEFIKSNKWFFDAQWEKVKIRRFIDGVHSLIWENGIWIDGTWEDGIWKNGTWKNGTWKYGIWENGTWENGTWKNGTWRWGTWRSGIWIDGYIWDQDAKEYKYSNLPPNECKWSLSYEKS